MRLPLPRKLTKYLGIRTVPLFAEVTLLVQLEDRASCRPAPAVAGVAVFASEQVMALELLSHTVILNSALLGKALMLAT